MIFDWTVNLGTIISTLVLVTTVIAGLYKVVANHMFHMEERIIADIRELRKFVFGLPCKSGKDCAVREVDP